MSYLLLVMEPKDQRRQARPEDHEHRYGSMIRYAKDLQARGVLKAAESLTSAGIRVENRGGRRNYVDGPFAEAKELVGGFFLLDCATREQALSIAGECPASEWASVEVREVGPCTE